MNTKISVSILEKLCNPFRDSVWNKEPISIREVREAIENERFLPIPYSQHLNRDYNHSERIAYFVTYGWNDPIAIEDGHHRLAVAIYRKDKYITSTVDGQISYANEILGKELE